MITSNDIDELSPPLRAILDYELRAGNKVVETWRGWPKATSIGVILDDPLTTPKEGLPKGITYNYLNDPHYWREELVDGETNHVLATKFK